MKELSIEKKAQAYEKVREKIAIRFGSNVADEIFSQFEMSEDEKIRKEIMRFIFDYPQKLTNRDSWLDWLEKKPSLLTKEKALKNSPFVEQKPTDKKGMNLVEEEMTPFQKEVFCIIDTTIEEEQGLKQVCDKLIALASNEIKQKPAWSEEDEENLNWFEKFFRAESVIAGGRDIPQDKYLWLKSLKERYTWKPSERQKEALLWCVVHLGGADKQTLGELLEELNKL